MNQEEFIKYWNHQIELGIKYRNEYSDYKNWKTYRAWYRSDFDETGNLPPKDQRFVNRIFSNARAMISRTYFRTPSIVVTPARPEFALHAKVLEAVDNYLVRELCLKDILKSAVLQAYLTGIGPIKLGYDSEFGFIPEQATDEDFETATQLSQKTGDKIEYRTNIKEGMPWALSVQPEFLITPFGIKDPKAFPWIAHAIIRPLKDVQEDQKYNSNKKKLKGGYIAEYTRGDLRMFTTLKEADEAFVLLYEIRDVKKGRVYIIAEDQILMDEEDVLQIEGLPWEFIIFNEDSEHFWPIPDVKLIAPHQIELNEIRVQQARMRRFSLIKFLYQKGVLSQEALDLLLSDNVEDVGAGIEVNADTIQSAIQPLKVGDLVADLLNASKAVEEDIRETLGLGSNQLGEFSPYHNKTASEAQIVERAAEIRMTERRDAVADVIANIIRKWNQYIFEFWTQERVIEIAGPEGALGWIKYTGDQLRGEYFVRVDPDVGLPVSRGIRHQQAMELLQMFNQDPLIDQIKLREKVLQQYDWLDATATELLSKTTPGNPMPFEQFLQEGANAGLPVQMPGMPTQG